MKRLDAANRIGPRDDAGSKALAWQKTAAPCESFPGVLVVQRQVFMLSTDAEATEAADSRKKNGRRRPLFASAFVMSRRRKCFKARRPYELTSPTAPPKPTKARASDLIANYHWQNLPPPGGSSSPQVPDQARVLPGDREMQKRATTRMECRLCQAQRKSGHASASQTPCEPAATINDTTLGK